MKSLASLAGLVSFSLAVGSACSKTKPSTVCPSGYPQVCLGTAADTCYCSPVSTCDYCTALFNATPGDSDSRCDAYRGQGSACQTTGDCQAAAGAGVSTKLVCHTGSDPYAFECVVMCSTDIDCPSGEQCAVGATSTGGVCGRACTASALYLDGAPDTGSTSSVFDDVCGPYHVTDPTCSSCLQTEGQTCANDAGTCVAQTLPQCEQQCANDTSVAARCACIQACAFDCVPAIQDFYACAVGACTSSDDCQ